MDGLTEQLFSFSDVVTDRFEGGDGGFKSTTGSNENDNYIEGESHNVSNNPVDESDVQGVDVNSSIVVGDDVLV